MRNKRLFFNSRSVPRLKEGGKGGPDRQSTSFSVSNGIFGDANLDDFPLLFVEIR